MCVSIFFAMGFVHKKDCYEWRLINFKMLPKKGELRNLNNWNVISLMKVSSKILSIMIKTRTQAIMKKEGSHFQFSTTKTTGCPEGSFTLWTLLQTRGECNTDIYVFCLDIVNAFNTENEKGDASGRLFFTTMKIMTRV